MKKFIVMALAVIVGSTASAQIVSSTSKEITTSQVVKAPSKKVRYFQGSLGLINLSGSDADDCENKIGFDLLYGYEKPIGKKGIWWGMEIGVGTSRGAEYSKYGYEESLLTYSVRFMPANFGYRYCFDNGLALEAHYGIGLSFDFAGNFEIGDETISIWDFADETEKDYVPLDVYMKLGVGVQYKKVGFDLSWQKGFIEPVEDLKASSSNVFVGVRYIF